MAERRIDLTPLITHRFALDDMLEAYELFSRQGDGVLKVALTTERSTAAVPEMLLRG